MKIKNRGYRHATDYERVSQFLIKTYATSGDHINWLQPRWEYMHYHPNIWDVDLNVIGVWEADDEIVGVAHLEHYMGRVYFEIDPAYDFLKREMLAYAEEHLYAATDDGKTLMAYINDRDVAFQAIAAEMGYQKQSGINSKRWKINPVYGDTI